MESGRLTQRNTSRKRRDDGADTVPEHHGNRLDHFGLLVLFIPLHPHPSIIMSQTLHSAVARGLREAGAVLREQGAAEVSVCRFPG